MKFSSFRITDPAEFRLEDCNLIFEVHDGIPKCLVDSLLVDNIPLLLDAHVEEQGSLRIEAVLGLPDMQKGFLIPCCIWCPS